MKEFRKEQLELIASELKSQHELLGYYPSQKVYEMSCKLWASSIAHATPKFDRQRFLEGCGLCLHNYADDNAKCVACGEQL